MTTPERHHAIVIVGGGAAGTTVAALLRKAKPDLDIAIIEPSEYHYYQPAWTLVGGGCYSAEATRRQTADLIPPGAKWIKTRAAGFDPQTNTVLLEDGSRVRYDFLVTAAGLQINWGKIQGLESALGKNGVTSNYQYDLAPYTWECIRQLRGGKALFTQPAMPIKCAGAPQKILYLAADHFRRNGVQAELSFLLPGAAMFGVPFYSQALDKVVANYGITARYAHNLVAVDGPKRKATFEVTANNEKKQVTLEFSMLHVVPPQSAPDFIKTSPLADASGWVSVDKHSLQHTQFSNVFGLGDCTTTPNSKTAAAVRAQAPVAAANLLRQLSGSGEARKYDGYASCPLTTSKGKIMLAEFGYDGVVMPSFALDPRIPRRRYWLLKKYYLPNLYWKMLRGNLGPDWHAKRDFPAAVPDFVP
ncbi:MAG: FAD-dependent oxidoreductase [Burkholderiales bacterium]